MDTFGKNPPLTIPKRQMDNFIRLTSIESEHILFVSPAAKRPIHLVIIRLQVILVVAQKFFSYFAAP